MSNKGIITDLQQRVRELRITAAMLVEEATIIEKELERIYVQQVSAPGKRAGNTLTDQRIAKIKASTARTLAMAMANS